MIHGERMDGAGAIGPGGERRSAPMSPAGWALAATTAVSCAFAFVGLSASSWWTDELFTLFIVDHRGGPAEVVRRALTDTHPPAYYLLLYGWSQVFGVSEIALRGLSALLAVGAVAVFVRETRGVFTREARAFAAAIAVTSPLWFFQSQNIRNYSLCFLLAALMLGLALGLRREVRSGRGGWVWRWAALTLVGALDAMTHFYGLLTVGALLMVLILTLPSWRLRAALTASGLLILGVDLAYTHALVNHTHEDFQHLWFRKDAAHLLRVPYDAAFAAVGGAARAAPLLLLAVWALAWIVRPAAGVARPNARPADGERAWLVGVCAFVLAFVYVGGVAVSLLFAPSLSDKNVLTAAPAVWVLLAGLYDVATSRLNRRLGDGVAWATAVLAAWAAVSFCAGRELPRNEEWRASAAYVASLSSCTDAALPVVQPDRFGPDTPFYRALAERYFFGRYLGARWPQVHAHARAAFTDPGVEPDFATALAVRARKPGACPVLAWAVHDMRPEEAARLQRGIARLPGLQGVPVRMRLFFSRHRKGGHWAKWPSAFVVERGASPAGPAAS